MQEACKFSRHSKRAILLDEDINNALRFYNCEVVHDAFLRSYKRGKECHSLAATGPADIRTFLQELHGFSCRDPLRFVRAASQADLYYLQDLEVPVNKVVAKLLW